MLDRQRRHLLCSLVLFPTAYFLQSIVSLEDGRDYTFNRSNLFIVNCFCDVFSFLVCRIEGPCQLFSVSEPSTTDVVPFSEAFFSVIVDFGNCYCSVSASLLCSPTRAVGYVSPMCKCVGGACSGRTMTFLQTGMHPRSKSCISTTRPPASSANRIHHVGCALLNLLSNKKR